MVKVRKSRYTLSKLTNGKLKLTPLAGVTTSTLSLDKTFVYETLIKTL